MTQLSLFSADLTPPQLADLGGLLAAHGQLTAGPDGVRLSILLGDRWRATALLRECRVRDIPAEITEPVGPAGGVRTTEPVAVARSASGADHAAGTDTGHPAPPVLLAQSGDVTTPRDATARLDVTESVRASESLLFRGILLGTERLPSLGPVAADWTRGAVKSVPEGLVITAGFLRCWTLAAGRPAEIGFLLGLDPHAPDTYEPLAAACAAAGLTGSLLGIRGSGPAVRIVGHRRCTRFAEMIGSPPPEAPEHAFPAHGYH